jgi:hypothetical protein
MSTKTVSTLNVTTQKISGEAQFEALKDGINTKLADVTTFILGKQTFARADLMTRIQARIDAFEATRTARKQWQAAVASEKALQAQVAPLRASLKKYLQARFGAEDPEMQSFGFSQAKTPQRTVAAKSAAVENAQATRAARGTKGKKQRLAIKAAPARTGATTSSATQTGATAKALVTTAQAPSATAPSPSAFATIAHPTSSAGPGGSGSTGA